MTDNESKWIYNKLEIQGNVAVLTSMTKANRNARVRRLTKDTYLNEATKEVCEYEHHENRRQNLSSLLRSFGRIRGIANANATRPETVRFATLTYADNMTDPKRLYRDFKAFWQRFKRWSKRSELPVPEYLLVVEPQDRGAWHGHLLLFYGNKRAPYIPHDELEALWGNGWVWITPVDHVDNLVACLSAYLTNADLDLDQDGDEIKVSRGTGELKSVVKGGRLHRYPTGMNIYRHSKGIKEPESYIIHEDYAEQWRKEHERTYGYETEYEDAVTGFKTRIRKEWYRKTPEGAESLISP